MPAKTYIWKFLLYLSFFHIFNYSELCKIQFTECVTSKANTLIVNGKRRGRVFVPHGQVHCLKQYTPLMCQYRWFCLWHQVLLLFLLVHSYGPAYTYAHCMPDIKFHMLLGWVIYLQSLGPTVQQGYIYFLSANLLLILSSMSTFFIFC